MLSASSRSTSRKRRQYSARIRLEVLESRLPPGDILFGLAFGSALLRSGDTVGDRTSTAGWTRDTVLGDSLELEILPSLEQDWPLTSGREVRAITSSILSEHREVPAFVGLESPPIETRRGLLRTGEQVQITINGQNTIVGVLRSKQEVTTGGLVFASAAAAPSAGLVNDNNTNDTQPLAFDRRAGVLHVRAEGSDQGISESVTPTGFVELTVAAQRHSADPASDFFDAALAGATKASLTGIWLESAGANETLILGSQQLASSFAVRADHAQVITQEVGTGGSLAIEAQSIIVRSNLSAGTVTLAGSHLISIEESGRVTAGQVGVTADIFVNAGQIHADGPAGGQVVVQSRNVLNAGPISADGQTGDGGFVGIRFSGSYVGTVAGITSANGVQAGKIRIDGGRTGRLYSSGSHLATGARGGQVDLLGREVVLPGAAVDASGQRAGGSVRIGGDFHGNNPSIANAQTVTVTGATAIRANSQDSGNGGHVAVWSEGETELAGSIAARGGQTGGDGGFIEVSGKGNLNYGGSADAGARRGKTGTLLLDPKNIVISAVGVFPQFDLIDPHPVQGGSFGYMRVLATGNVLVFNPNDDFGGRGAGAAYLFDGSSGALLSSLVGGNPNDAVGLELTLLNNGNYLIQSQLWNAQRGAVTWGDSRAGVSGVVSDVNSLVGSNPYDAVGSCGIFFPRPQCITPLSNGNYLILSLFWNGQRGAVTWGDSRTGVRGAVSSANSLIGSETNDRVGSDRTGYSHLVFLSNGNYLVQSPEWNGNRGAVTWGDGRTGVRGIVSETNSLVGSNPNDRVGCRVIQVIYCESLVVTGLSNSNYLVRSPDWNGRRGAVTWGNGSVGVRGAVSDDNSLVGSNLDDRVGSDPEGIMFLSNGNYVVRSPEWNDKRGAVTWGDASAGVRGTVSEANSLVGSDPNDRVGGGLVAPLTNGNYVVRSPQWNGERGAATWGNGRTGVRGMITDANSLVGSNPNDHVGGAASLPNGNYVVLSQDWNERRGAVTWADGSTGIRGAVSDGNSFIASNPNDRLGSGGIRSLTNGNYLVLSPEWNGQRGAVTWGDSRSPILGTVSDANSLIGSNLNDHVGSSGIVSLTSGNYLVLSPEWNDRRGAVTWGSGSGQVRGIVSDTNSLIGGSPGDRIGTDQFDRSSITLLPNGNYLVQSLHWNTNRGAVTWGDVHAGVKGIVSEANSLVGSNANDQVGISGITLLSNGNYLVRSGYWSGSRGAVTWGDSSTGVRGIISEANSLVGSSPYDTVGGSGITFLNDGNYVVGSQNWNGGRGATTWGDSSRGVRGIISEANSLVGSRPSDSVGVHITTLSDGNYAVQSPGWNDSRGAVTWGDGSAGVRGPVSEANSLVGSNRLDSVGYDNSSIVSLGNGNYVIKSSRWNDARGAVTWMDGRSGVHGVVSETNSLVGSDPNDKVGSGFSGSPDFVPLSNGNYLVLSPLWHGGRGAVTWADGLTGVRGSVSDANSLVGSGPHDLVGEFPALLSNGNYLVLSQYDGRGAVTWGSSTRGLRGPVSQANSLVGSDSNDRVGFDMYGIPSVTALSNGNYLVRSPFWNARHGALTWGDGTNGQTLDGRNLITRQNSLLGRVPNSGLAFAQLDPVHQSFLAPFITDGGGRVAVGLPGPNQFTYARAQAQSVALTPGFLTRILDTGTDVVLQASNDITIDDPITVHANGKGGILTLQAGRSIILNANITTDNGALTLIANDTLANGVVDAQRDPGNAVITMAAGTTLDTGTGPLNIELRDGAGRTNTSSHSINLQTITAGSVTVANNGPSPGSDIRLASVSTDGAQSYSSPNGTTIAAGDLTAADGPITFNNSAALNAGVTLSAKSDTVRFVAGTVAPGPGVVTIVGSVALSEPNTWSVTLNGAAPGSYSQLAASGPVDLGNSTLAFVFGFVPPIGSSYEIVAAGGITNTFNDLAEGALFEQGGYVFQITYQGGNKGTSVVVTRVG